VEAFDPKAKSNSMDARTEPCIVLYPAANVMGSWMMWSLRSRSYVRRSIWKKLLAPEVEISMMNEVANVSKIATIEPSSNPTAEETKEPEEQVVRVDTVIPGEPDRINVTPEEANVEDEEIVKAEEDAKAKEPDAVKYDEDVVNDPPEPVIRRSEQPTGAGKRTQNEDYLYSLTQMSISLGLKTHGEMAEEANRAEFDQPINKKKALKPVEKSSLSTTQLKNILRSSMF
jgi:hypothetical protein